MDKKGTMIDLLTSLSKQRGFIFQSSEIYGGLGSTWDYGPLGIELKRNIKNHWWKTMVTQRENVVGMDAAILMHPDVWHASGHIDNFHDPLVDNKESKKRYRLDHLLEDQPDEVIDFLLDKLFADKTFQSMEETYQAIVQELTNLGSESETVLNEIRQYATPKA